MQGVTENCHYVSRCFTRPWETPDRQLLFFDFKTGDVEKKSSKNLFAKKGLNAQATEKRLERLIETPFARARDRARKHGFGKALEEYEAHRAVRLGIFLQSKRIQEANDEPEAGASGMTLERFLSYTDEQLDAIVAQDAKERHLLWLPTPGFFLSFPSTGLCAVPVVDPGVPWGFSMAIAMPFNLQSYVGLAETTTAKAEICGPFVEKPFCFSIGAHNAKQVIVPPICEDSDREETIAAMTNNRDRLVEVLAALAEKRQIIADAYEKFGLWPK